MQEMFFGFARHLLAGSAPASAGGTWSLYTLLLVLFIACVSIILLVLLLIWWLSGRFAVREEAAEFGAELAKAHAADGDDGEEGDETEAAGEAPAKEKKAAKAKKPENGLKYLLLAIAMPVPAAIVFALADNTNGMHVMFSLGTALELVLLAGQIGLALVAANIQRRLG